MTGMPNSRFLYGLDMEEELLSGNSVKVTRLNRKPVYIGFGFAMHDCLLDVQEHHLYVVSEHVVKEFPANDMQEALSYFEETLYGRW
ncbi:hypothetical protein FACS1894109_11160 [Spirochaetia bacterium]|nr:hypothetical protein FACS1894109_11160 [Spirochaetia bacterium]